ESTRPLQAQTFLLSSLNNDRHAELVVAALPSIPALCPQAHVPLRISLQCAPNWHPTPHSTCASSMSARSHACYSRTTHFRAPLAVCRHRQPHIGRVLAGLYKSAAVTLSFLGTPASRLDTPPPVARTTDLRCQSTPKVVATLLT